MTAVNAARAGSNQKECRSAAARLNSSCATALQETGKSTCPSWPVGCTCASPCCCATSAGTPRGAARSAITARIAAPYRFMSSPPPVSFLLVGVAERVGRRVATLQPDLVGPLGPEVHEEVRGEPPPA